MSKVVEVMGLRGRIVLALLNNPPAEMTRESGPPTCVAFNYDNTVDAILSYIDAAGFAVVPKEATREMIAAARAMDWDNEDEDGTAHNLWNVMSAAGRVTP